MRGASYGLIGSVLMLLAQSALPAWADGKDCPLLGMLDNFFRRPRRAFRDNLV